jgi:2-hydroxycyclohexanecarboxyl-CoA dehydrogenase
MRGLQGKVAMVTGAASGIGQAVALRLGEEGCHVAALDLNLEGARETAAKIGNGATAVEADVTSLSSMQEAVRRVEKALGKVDVLASCAGWDQIGPFMDSDEEMWKRVLGINLMGVMAGSRAVLDSMLERKTGSIVSIASEAGRVGVEGEVVYSAAKAGVIGFSKGLAREVVGAGIRVNVVSPGPTDTPMMASHEGLAEALVKIMPVGRLARPEEIASVVAFLTSDDASFMTGQTLSVSCGLTMV